MLPEADQILFSEEGITHDLMPRGPSAGGFDQIEQSANILEMLGADDLHVVLAIRRQDHFRASTYAHYVHRQALSLSAEDWFRRVVDPTRLSWASVIDVFERRFGKANLTIIPLDRAKNDFAGYIAWVVAAAGIDSSGWTMRPDASNPSLSEKGIDLARAINERAGTEHKRRRQVINTIIREFPASEFGKFSLDDTAIPADLGRLYDAENRALGARWFPEHADALGFDSSS